MSGGNDRSSASPAGASARLDAAPALAERLAPASALPAPESGDAALPGADPLSDVLRAVRLTTAVFFHLEAASPWVIGLPDGAALARGLAQRAQHVISYHVVVEGRCWGGLPGHEPVALSAGDVLVLPRGDPYAMSLTPDLRGGPDAGEVVGFLRAMARGELPFTVTEDGGGQERMRLVCGFLGCDLRPFNPLLASLPRLLLVRRDGAPRSDALARLIELTLAESDDRRAGSECVRLRLAELLFVEVVRRHLAALPAEQTGWLAGLRDPVVGRALARLHERPEHPWTLEELARHAGASRSVLAERFAHLVGDPPIQYLTRWRMQVAARLLAETTTKVAAVGVAVGYDSEAAFSRAFKKAAGVPPAAWRARYGVPLAGRG